MAKQRAPRFAPVDCLAEVDYTTVAGLSILITGGMDALRNIAECVLNSTGSSGLGAAYVKAFSDSG